MPSEEQGLYLCISSPTLAQSLANIAKRMKTGRVFLFQRDKRIGEAGTPVRNQLQESGLEMMD